MKFQNLNKAGMELQVEGHEQRNTKVHLQEKWAQELGGSGIGKA